MNFNYKIISKRLDNDLPSFLSLKGIKTYLRIDFDKDDSLLTKIAVAVCERAESFIKMNILERSIKQVIYDFTGSRLKLYKQPVIRVSKVLDQNYQAISKGLWSLDDDSDYVFFNNDLSVPSITIEYIAGFTNRTISQAIKYGLLEHIAHIYDGKATAQEFPASSFDLYLSFRKYRMWR